MKLVRVVLSDLHLGTGRRRGAHNPLEDFHHDDRLAELLDYYSTGKYADFEVEVILNGDIFDLMKVDVDGGWPTEVTEALAIDKLRRCLEGHPRAVAALRGFLERPGKRITYIPGNHDPELLLPAVQDLLRRYVAPGAAAGRLSFVTASEVYSLPEGIQIRHGHQFEAIFRMDYKRLMLSERGRPEVMALPWGTLWCMQVLFPAKRKRPHIDQVVPFRRFLAGAILFDFSFTFAFCVRTALHFLTKRLRNVSGVFGKLRAVPAVLRDEILAISDFDTAAIRTLRRLRGVHTLIVGHSHAPRVRALEGGKLYVNTGSWVRMINLDVQHLGQENGLTYALIEYDAEGKPETNLLRWFGMHREHEPVLYQS
ncbi:MAG: metallophosphoesterase [Polyangiaceae bacterium]